MNKMQKGFTLIELMIVVAIIAILAAIAVPQYQNYTKRSKVTEGLALADAAKLAVSETYQTNGTFPTDQAGYGYTTGETTYVKSLVIGDKGVLTVTYQNIADDINNRTIILTPSVSASAIQWSCNHNKGWGSTGNVPPQYLPATCR
jgi:type IV pilus assembly protein PilA